MVVTKPGKENGTVIDEVKEKQQQQPQNQMAHYQRQSFQSMGNMQMRGGKSMTHRRQNHLGYPGRASHDAFDLSWQIDRRNLLIFIFFHLMTCKTCTIH